MKRTGRRELLNYLLQQLVVVDNVDSLGQRHGNMGRMAAQLAKKRPLEEQKVFSLGFSRARSVYADEVLCLSGWLAGRQTMS